MLAINKTFMTYEINEHVSPQNCNHKRTHLINNAVVHCSFRRKVHWPPDIVLDLFFRPFGVSRIQLDLTRTAPQVNACFNICVKPVGEGQPL